MTENIENPNNEEPTDPIHNPDLSEFENDYPQTDTNMMDVQMENGDIFDFDEKDIALLRERQHQDIHKIAAAKSLQQLVQGLIGQDAKIILDNYPLDQDEFIASFKVEGVIEGNPEELAKIWLGDELIQNTYICDIYGCSDPDHTSELNFIIHNHREPAEAHMCHHKIELIEKAQYLFPHENEGDEE